MKFDIEDNIIKAAVRCGKEFGCVCNESHILCNVEDSIKNRIQVISCLEFDHCSYKFSYEGVFICGCPVRKKIFSKYKV